jgi:hypothetical protein
MHQMLLHQMYQCKRYTGKLSCFRPGISTHLPRSIASARATRALVVRGMITSSM